MWESGDDQRKVATRFKFEKWWLQHKDFRELVQKIWCFEVKGDSALDR
jgi:hypothetical protein